MTFKEAMIQEMERRGMFLQQAEQIMNQIITENKIELMDGRWYESTQSYPDNLSQILWSGVKGYAYQWIEKNLPQAWFKPLFQFSDEQLQEMVKRKKQSNA